eukprot:TRINITY_DN1071_c0_g1_i2.p1 TRINITY_DN1071_c0_g1~~TRINITY_DN1071_c0_g1_i2.p1  ORF type:complete len:106 (+),score=19.25 TRINITY_DN1071_c0_g1_i2:61-378(+)
MSSAVGFFDDIDDLINDLDTAQNEEEKSPIKQESISKSLPTTNENPRTRRVQPKAAQPVVDASSGCLTKEEVLSILHSVRAIERQINKPEHVAAMADKIIALCSK